MAQKIFVDRDYLATELAKKANSSHTHNYAGSSSAGGAANSVKTNLIIKLNGGTTEGTNLFTYNGSTAKTVNITPSAIGAAASSHGTHLTLGTGSGNAYYGDKGKIAYDHSQVAHAPSNAQKNSDITKAEIEAKLTGTIASHKHTLLESNDTRSTNELPSTYTNRGIVPEFKSSTTIGLPSVGKGFTGLITYQQWSDTSAWSGGKATQFGTIDDGRMYYRKGDGSGWGSWYQFYTTQNKPTSADIGAAPTSHASTATTYGAASASNYGHAMATSTTPKANGTAAVGSETAKFARGDHVHPLQTTVSGNAGTATTWQTSRTLTIGNTGKAVNGSANVSWSLAEIGAIPLTGNTGAYSITGNLEFASPANGTFRGVVGKCGVNDYWRVGGSATADNAGYMEIATADDYNEPIYVRQYTGAYATLKRTATLLDASGNTSFPGNVTVGDKVSLKYNSTSESLDFIFI